MDIVGASILAKFVASTVSYPHEVLRTRMQDARRSHNQSPSTLFGTARNMVETEGVWSLWTGLRVNLIRVVPATVATFLSYEYILKWLEDVLL